MVIFKFSYVFLIHLLLSIGIAESFSGGRQSNTLSFTSIRRRQQSSCYANFPLHTRSDQEPSVKKSRVVKSTPLLNLLSIDTFEDFTSTLKQHHSDIIVVRFHSPWCKVWLHIFLDHDIVLATCILTFHSKFTVMCINCTFLPPTCTKISTCNIYQCVYDRFQSRSPQRFEYSNCPIWTYLYSKQISGRNETDEEKLEIIWNRCETHCWWVLQIGWSSIDAK